MFRLSCSTSFVITTATKVANLLQLLLVSVCLCLAHNGSDRSCFHVHHGQSPWTRERCSCIGTAHAVGRTSEEPFMLQAKGLVYSLRNFTQTINVLKATGSEVSYVPADGMFNIDRTSQWVHALGDITVRVRPADRWLAELPFPAGLEQYPQYTKFTTAAAGPGNPASNLRPSLGQVGAVNLTGCLLQDPRFPLQILRWYEEPDDPTGGIRMVVEVTNRDPYVALDIAGLSVDMVFQGRTDGIKLVDLPKTTLMVDAYVGLHHGYATVIPASGRGPVLVVFGENGTSLEAWGTNFDDDGSTILGTPEWIIHSAAYQEEEWKANDGPWNAPTRTILQPLKSMRVTLRLAVAGSLRQVDDVLSTAGIVVAKGVPGYVCSTSFQTAKLMLRLLPGLEVVSWKSEPSGRLQLQEPVQQGKWTVFPLACSGYGRACLTVAYTDGSLQSIHYFVVGDIKQHVDRFGQFQASTAWLPRETRDPFGRSASVMPWDSQAGKHVLHDSRAFVVGLSDEAGAGANVGLAIKAQHSPSISEAQRLDEYINSTLWGMKEPPEVPYSISLQDHSTHGIRASLFYVPNPAEGTPGMPGFQYLPGDTSGWIWGRNYVGALGRAYNYPHQIVSYWSMYRIARNYDLIQFSQPASWYLEQAGNTVLGMWKKARWYTQMGLMAGTVFAEVLADLEREGMTDLARGVKAIMYNRTAVGITFLSSQPCGNDLQDPFTCTCTNLTQSPSSNPGARAEIHCPPWRGHPFPFGSEFAWDTTGQEEVYVWSNFFNFTKEAQLAIDAILAFMPGMPHWAYNGAALGMGDFSNNAKWTYNGGWERVLCHYRAGLNNIPVIREWLRNPTDTYLLGIGMGALAAHITNIAPNGAARMGFHGDPSILQHDPYSGDFGVGFFGHSILSASYLTFGHLDATWLCFFCDALELQLDAYHNLSSLTRSGAQPILAEFAAALLDGILKHNTLHEAGNAQCEQDCYVENAHRAQEDNTKNLHWEEAAYSRMDAQNDHHEKEDSMKVAHVEQWSSSAGRHKRKRAHGSKHESKRSKEERPGGQKELQVNDAVTGALPDLMKAFRDVGVQPVGDAWRMTQYAPVRVVPKDSYHRRLYIQPLGLQVLLLNSVLVNADLLSLSPSAGHSLLLLNVTTASFPFTTRLRVLLDDATQPGRAQHTTTPRQHGPAQGKAKTKYPASRQHSARLQTGKLTPEQATSRKTKLKTSRKALSVNKWHDISQLTHCGQSWPQANASNKRAGSRLKSGEIVADAGNVGIASGNYGFSVCELVNGAHDFEIVSGVWEVDLVQPVQPYIQLLVCGGSGTSNH